MKQLVFTAGLSILLLASLTGIAPNVQPNNAGGTSPALTSHAIEKGSAPKNSALTNGKSTKDLSGAGESGRAASSIAAKSATGLSLADILGIVFFFALISTHFCFCRKGVYPESFALCDRSAKSKRHSPEENSEATE